LGINATASLCLLQGSPIWLANDLTVRYAQGYTPVRVSNHAIEYSIARRFQTASSADAFTYTEQGHSYYVLNLPADTVDGVTYPAVSWAYDLSTSLWHQRGPYNSGSDSFDQLPVQYCMQIPGSSSAQTWPAIVGQRSGHKLFFMSQRYSTEIDGTTQQTRRRRAPNLVSELKNTRYANFQLFAEVGVITPTPTALLQWSNNGGQTFNTGTSMSAGALSDYTYRILWRGSQGMARNRCFQVTTASPLRLVDAYVDISVGAS